MIESNQPPEPTVDVPPACHQVDDLQCLRNRVPRWWTSGFLLSIAIIPLYMFFHHNGVEGRSVQDSYSRALAANMNLQLQQIGDITVDGEGVRRFMQDDAWLSVGKSVFKTHCASCHGAAGGGIVGPNLGDDVYKNIRSLDDFIHVLKNGAGGGAMPAWKTKLDDNQIVLVSSYVASLRNTNPPGGKSPEGQKISPW